ncbi:MAG: L-rhamnose mutarotase [Acidobacteria bacterium]|nr:L-rhamnose mutarotase [Acidobacteriota bacterium]
MRQAFILTIRPGMEERYRETHRAVWPELIVEASRAGIRNHSSFVNGRTVFVYVEADNIDEANEKLMQVPIKLRWNKFMEDILEPGSTPLEEVFHMD